MGLRDKFGNLIPQDDELKLASQSGAPAPAFQLSEERKASPEFQQAHEDMPQFNDRMVREAIARRYGKDQGDKMVASMELPMQAAGMIGSVADASGILKGAGSLVAPMAEEAVAASQAAGPASSKFGRILQIFKDRVPQPSQPVDPKLIKNILRAKR